MNLNAAAIEANVTGKADGEKDASIERPSQAAQKTNNHKGNSGLRSYADGCRW